MERLVQMIGDTFWANSQPEAVSSFPHDSWVISGALFNPVVMVDFVPSIVFPRPVTTSGNGTQQGLWRWGICSGNILAGWLTRRSVYRSNYHNRAGAWPWSNRKKMKPHCPLSRLFNEGRFQYNGRKSPISQGNCSSKAAKVTNSFFHSLLPPQLPSFPLVSNFKYETFHSFSGASPYSLPCRRVFSRCRFFSAIQVARSSDSQLDDNPFTYLRSTYLSVKMYASRITIFLLAFVVALASAVPLHSHHRRSKCHRRATAPDVAANIPETSTRGYSPPASVKTGSPIPSSSAEPDETKESKESKKPTKTKEVEDPTETSKSSAPDSSDAPAPSESSSSGSGSGSGGYSGGLLGSLFPVSNLISSWTTCSAARDDTQELSDAVFRPVSDMKDLPHPYVDGPEGKRSMKAHYPKGSYNFQHEPKGGFSFYAPGPSDVDLTTAKEATFGYSVYFRDGFGFQKGGKLPGLYGGDSASESLSCSGGRRDNGCFSARLMWRTKGQVELYTYLPPDHNDGLCDKVPNSDCNPTYGASLGRGAATFPTGEWVAVSQRLKLNDVGKSNGELELFVNGKSVVNVRGLVITTSEAGRIRGMQMQTFFGGSSPDFASPKDQDVYFSDFSVSITKKR